QKRPGIGVGAVVDVLKSTGEQILDQRNGLTIPRIQIDRALDGLNSVANAPATPDGLVATTISATQIDLVWNDVADETGYRIERKGSLNGSWSVIASGIGANVTSYQDVGLTPGRTYFYQIYSLNGSSASVLPSDTVRATTQAVPLAPTNLTATVASPTQINLSWADNATNEKSYSIRRSLTTGGPYIEVAQVAANTATFMNSGLVSGTTYYYIVVAINGGAESTASNEATGSTPEIVPSAPTGLTVAIQAITNPTTLVLNWSDNSNNETGFRIERRLSTGDFTVVTTSPSTTPTNTGARSYTDTGLVKNTQYFYRIFAINSVGDSLVSNVASGTTPDTPPSAPGNLVATAASVSQINLSWSDNSDNETSFKVFQRTAGGTYGSTPTPIATLPANTTSYQATGLIDTTQYFYQVRASNSGGDSAATAEANATTLPLPDPAENLIVDQVTSGTERSSKLRLRWDDKSTIETGFKIRRSTTPGGPYTVVKTVPINATATAETIDTELLPSQRYYYVVTAFNANGDAENSNEANATTPPLPASPTSVTASVNSGTPLSISVSWNVTGSNQKYDLYRRSNNTAPFVYLDTTNVDTTTFTDNQNLSGRQSYQYQVVTINDNGRSTPPTTSNEVTTPAGPPAAPSMLTATPASGTSITLTWIDNSETETEFRIERSLTTPTAYTQVGVVPVNTTSFTDTGLTSGTTYYYRVFAFRAAHGTDPAYTSDSSNEVSTAPPPIPNAPTGVVASAATPTSVTLTWTDASANEVGFRIRRKSGAGAYAQVGTTLENTTSFTDTTVGDGTSYDYQVNAYNVAGNSNDGAPVTVITPLPAPGSLTAAPINATTIRLTWNDLSANETSFRVERKTGADPFTTIAAALPANTTSYNDSTGLIVSTPYVYQVTAVNSTIASPPSNTPTSQLLPLPTAASGLNASPNSATAVQLTWNDNSNNEDGFRISRKTGSSGTYATIATVSQNTTTHVNTGLTEGTQYFYQVTAFNVSGDATTSPEDSATTRSNAPVNMAATIVNSTSV
ncbi:MAG: fibronectin type III domain-containing protein, partial [Acidobacteriota bacterium]